MHMKYRQAAANMAKQAQLVKPKQVDPLSTICAERIQAIRKTKFIHKEKSMFSKDQIKRIFKNELSQTLTKNEHQNIMKKRRKNHLGNVIHVNKNVWQKYLPQCSDQFQDIHRICEQEEYSAQVFKQTQSKNQLNNQENQSTNPIFNKSFQKQKGNNSIKMPSLETVAEKQKFQLSTIDFESLKQKLGIIKKQQVKVVVQQQKVQIKPSLKQSKNTALLPFAGRPFEQAPERPAPKMIYQYPPTCKVAGLYPWPPPKSQYRMWKSQMREARKLN